MTRRSYRPEKIIKKLREVEALLNGHCTVGEAAGKIGVTEQTYYRWRRQYGDIRIEQFSLFLPYRFQTQIQPVSQSKSGTQSGRERVTNTNHPGVVPIWLQFYTQSGESFQQNAKGFNCDTA